MAKKKLKLSPGDKLSIFIASIALISAIFTTYIQFFHKTTEFRIGTINLVKTNDSLSKQLNISMLLINTGTNPVAYNTWNTFLSADESLPKGSCYTGSIGSQNNGFYMFGCSSRSEIIIEPNTVEFVNLKLVISNDDLAEYMKLNQIKISDPTPYINVGARMTFIDSNGEIKSKEIIFGAVYYNDSGGSGHRIYVKPTKEFKIY
ncbi:hypothetical protein OAD62_02975 [Oceanihabitans sp.]|nr:hypothetical protein [Oceanihabitans sp.]